MILIKSNKAFRVVNKIVAGSGPVGTSSDIASKSGFFAGLFHGNGELKRFLLSTRFPSSCFAAKDDSGATPTPNVESNSRIYVSYANFATLPQETHSFGYIRLSP